MKYKDLLQKQYLAKNIVAPAFYGAGYKKIAEHINDCSKFKRYSVCSDCGQIYFNGSYVCRERFCPICNKKRSMIYFYRFVPVIKKLLSRGYYVNMLNFTLVDDSNLQHSLDVLTKAFRYIQHDSKEYRKMFNSMFVGGVSSKEIKLGENSKLWHPHIHCIVIKDHYSEDFEYLKLIWNNSVRLAGGNASATDPTKYGSVYISSIVDRTSHLSDKQSSVEVGVLETMKYITKFDYQLDSALIPELVKSLKNVRTVNTWGVLRNIFDGVENDMLKPYSELYKNCCTVCGSNDFYDFCSTHSFKDVADFDLDKALLVKESKVLFGNNNIISMVKLKKDLVIGQTYGGVVYGKRQADYQNNYFQVTHYKDEIYIVRQFDRHSLKELSPIAFSKDMFDFDITNQ